MRDTMRHVCSNTLPGRDPDDYNDTPVSDVPQVRCHREGCERDAVRWGAFCTLHRPERASGPVTRRSDPRWNRSGRLYDGRTE